jgi:hypothetical protein
VDSGEEGAEGGLADESGLPRDIKQLNKILNGASHELASKNKTLEKLRIELKSSQLAATSAASLALPDATRNSKINLNSTIITAGEVTKSFIESDLGSILERQSIQRQKLELSELKCQETRRENLIL